MKSLIIYYSLDGNTRMIAELIKNAAGSDILQLKPVHDNNKKGLFKILSGGIQVLKNEKPELLPVDINPDDYELIFIGTPVWAGSFAPALNTFFSKTPVTNKKIVLFCCLKGGMGKIFSKLRELLKGNTVISEKEFISPLKKEPDKTNEDLRIWIDEVFKKLN